MKQTITYEYQWHIFVIFLASAGLLKLEAEDGYSDATSAKMANL